MHRIRIILAATAAVALLSVAAAPAPASVSSAAGIAQSYQNSECGFGATWLCNNARYLPQSCFDGGSSIRYYQCNGAFRQVSFLGDYRVCSLYVNVQKGTGDIIYHWDACRH